MSPFFLINSSASAPVQQLFSTSLFNNHDNASHSLNNPTPPVNNHAPSLYSATSLPCFTTLRQTPPSTTFLNHIGLLHNFAQPVKLCYPLLDKFVHPPAQQLTTTALHLIFAQGPWYGQSQLDFVDLQLTANRATPCSTTSFHCICPGALVWSVPYRLCQSAAHSQSAKVQKGFPFEQCKVEPQKIFSAQLNGPNGKNLKGQP